MSVAQQGRAAWRIYRTFGVRALMQSVQRRIADTFGPPRPDEPMMAFHTLEASKTPGVMIDVGAHFGGSLAPFAECDWKIYAFEPDPENRERLLAVFGERENVTVDSRAVSNRSGEKVAFFKSEESTGISSLSAFRQSHREGGYVETVTLDDFLSDHGVDKVDLLKIDIEGHDFFALKGFPWERITPRMIICEFGDERTKPLGYTFHNIADWLQDRGYQVIVSEWLPITEYGTPHDWRHFAKYPCELLSLEAWGNLIATKDERLFGNLVTECTKFRPLA